MTDTILKYWEQLDHRDKHSLIFALNMAGINPCVHMGTLPFVGVDKAMAALNGTGRAVIGDGRQRKWMKACETKFTVWTDSCCFALYLDAKKVSKRFGPHPERGMPLKVLRLKRVTVGVKWSLPKRDHVPDDDVHVYPSVTLRCDKHSNSKWYITCHKDYHNQVMDFLLDHCT
jgi:hypothetical protein